jgi:CelD/BcsL family acetyltransferase involved in cellulose biosynthesis
MSKPSDMQTEVITAPWLSQTLLAEWSDLHARIGRFPFTNPIIFQAWWENLGHNGGHTLHVVTVRQAGRLVAIAPQTVSRYKILRVLQWAGGNDLGYCDALCETADVQTALWSTIRRSRRYDIGLIKTLHSDSQSCAVVETFSRQVRHDVNYIIDVKWPSSAVWLKEISPRTRKQFRNLENQIKAKAPLSFEIVREGLIPWRVLAALVEQKAQWAKANHKSCMFDRPAEALLMLTELAHSAAAENLLHLAWLQAGDDVIATLYSVIQNHVMYCMVTSYDPVWHKQSPGRILLYKVFAWAMDNGITKIDLMQGENEYKKGVADISPISLNDFTFPGSIWGRMAEPILARTYFKDRSAAPVEANA